MITDLMHFDISLSSMRMFSAERTSMGADMVGPLLIQHILSLSFELWNAASRVEKISVQQRLMGLSFNFRTYLKQLLRNICNKIQAEASDPPDC
jgi:hypothetical protein